MCCAFSLWFDSLSSAATSVGAKPNHGFFNCQLPRAVFSPPPAVADLGTCRDCSASRRRECARTRPSRNLCFYESAQIKRFSCNAWLPMHFAKRTRVAVATPRAHRHEGVRTLSASVRATASFRRRTSSIAPKCARISRHRQVGTVAVRAPWNAIDESDASTNVVANASESGANDRLRNRSTTRRRAPDASPRACRRRCSRRQAGAKHPDVDAGWSSAACEPPRRRVASARQVPMSRMVPSRAAHSRSSTAPSTAAGLHQCLDARGAGRDAHHGNRSGDAGGVGVVPAPAAQAMREQVGSRAKRSRSECRAGRNVRSRAPHATLPHRGRCSVSGRLLPAARRSRPVPAIRSTGRVRRSRRRRSSLRRRRPR